MNICSIDGCEKQVAARTWCHAHYKKWSLHGDPKHGIERTRKNGEGTVNYAGYIAIGVGKTKKMQNVIVVEKAIGHELPKDAVVHHIDGNRKNNSPSNLLVCPDHSYHRLLHLREKARDACGNPSYRMCIYCRKYDSLENMTRTGNNKSGHRHYHKPCRNKNEQERKLK